MTKNENGVYLNYQTETVASVGRSSAKIEIAHCEDGLYRYALDVRYSYGGFCGPITDDGDGYVTHEAAKAAGIEQLRRRLPKPGPSEPQTAHAELKAMLNQLAAHDRQLSLF